MGRWRKVTNDYTVKQYDNRNGNRTRYFAFKIYGLDKCCEECWYTWKGITVHHKNHNPWNEEKENYKIMCTPCHSSYHCNDNSIWVQTMIKANTWRECTEETREKIRQWNLWKFVSNKTKAKQRKAALWNKRWRNSWKLVDWMWYTEWRATTGGSGKDFYKLTK